MSETRNSNLLWKITVVVLFCCLVMGSLCLNTALALTGVGTQEEPWRIQSLADFDEFAADANYWDDYTRLETDINLAGRVYSRAVIAPDTNNANWWFDGTAFTGVFDGNDHKITNLTINDTGAGNYFLGLFGYIDYGEVSNLGVEGGSVIGTERTVGGLIGFIRGSISNCYCTGDVSGDRNVGGLVGSGGSSTSISNCYSTGDVHGVDYVGGLVGLNDSYIISNCYSTGDVNGVDDVGGLVGRNYYDVSDCYSTGDVNGVDDVGGLVGLNTADVWNCYSTGRVEGKGGNMGGLFGANGYMPTTSWCFAGWIENCYWDTQTSGESKMCGDQWPCASYGCDNSYGRTTSQLHQQSTFANWDFIHTWNIGENQTYPYLRTVSASDINKDRITNFFDLCIVAEEWMEEE